jgi:excinuclease ABC subunit C
MTDVESLPNQPAVFILRLKDAPPYLSKTGLLRRRMLRLQRLLGDRIEDIEYHLTGSAFESTIVHYELARQLFPETYLDRVKLRMPPYLKIVLANDFPRSHITTHLTRTPAVYFGPFRSRTSAERFESQFLDLFQMRRCQEDLVVSPEHPGCIYGEMGMCLRPCQEVVGIAEYRTEVDRVVEFLRTGGRSLAEAIERRRDRLSEEMQFEEAARQHKRLEKVQEVLKLSDELARDVDRLSGVAITPSLAQDAVEMWFVRDGNWCEPRRFAFEVAEGKPVSLDRKLRDLFAELAPRRHTVRDRQEYLALLSRWYYSSWRDGEWLPMDGPELPYRKLVNAVHRVAKRSV